MKLTDLNPRWLYSGLDDEGDLTADSRRVGVTFDCPCGCSPDGQRVAIEFSNPIEGGAPTRSDGHTWQRTGETFETLTLSPSILRRRACGWHGFVTNGEIRTA